MDMTITQKIIAEHAGLKEVHPGQLINAKVDIRHCAMMLPVLWLSRSSQELA